MGKYNVDLMLAVREQITNHPETHSQAHWGNKNRECGTTYCIAGWAITLAQAGTRWNSSGLMALADGMDPGDCAQRLMGLSSDEATDLFFTMDRPSALAKLDELIAKGKNRP
ncbi:hypothetical protein ACGF5F_29470 [Streptomyces sp. NPDC047821]|uniref:hypothetical protein n=1 Tax=Streptomyces sp. NPDC047821 TaxID=3365488 RepID=UPI003717AD36